MNYALNWALCAKGIAPKGEAYRNLRESELKELNATIPEPTKSTTVYARGSYSVGAAGISKAHFSRIFREVVTFLTSTPKLYVHDGAVGSSPRSDAKVRTVSDSPSSALLFRSILEPAPTRKVAYQEFPFTVYIASGYSPSDVGSVGLASKDKGAFVAIDYDRSAMILGGSAFTDVETVKKALVALTAPSILSRDALPLSARLLVQGGATVVVFAPESVIQKNAGLLKAAVSPDLGLVWSKEGVARLFASKESGAPNLYKTPSSVVLVTADSTGAVPEISKVTPEKAGALFVAGYNGDEFQPGYQSGPGSVDPVELAKGFTSLLESTNIPAFLVNASVLPENDLLYAMRELRLLVGRYGNSWTSFEDRFPRNFAFSPATRGGFNSFLQNGEGGIGMMLCVRHVLGIDTLDDSYCSNFSKGVDSRLSGLSYRSIHSSTNAVRDGREEVGGSRISTWNLISCNAAISRFAQQGRPRQAFSLFFRMQDEHLRPNRITFLSLLKAFSSPNDLEGGKRVHDLIFKQHLESDVRVGTALICMYFRCGSPQDAHRVFTGIQNRDLIVWNALIEGYCLANLREQALETFRVMRIEGIQPDMATFLSILKSCNEPSHMDEGQRLHKVIIESGLELSVRIQTAIVRMYSKCGSLVDARRVFDKLPRKDVGLWTTMIAGYAQAGHGEEAFERFEAMRKAGMHPNKMTFLALLKACTKPEFLQKGKWLHDQIKFAGYDTDEKVGTVLIKMYSKCRSLEDARQVFNNLPRKNVISWTALISGYVLNGRVEEALDLYEQMQREGVQPNEITRNTVVDACSRLGAV